MDSGDTTQSQATVPPLCCRLCCRMTEKPSACSVCGQSACPSLRISAVQRGCVPGCMDDNIQIIAEETAKAKDAGSRLVVFPELFLSGYHLPDTTSFADVAVSLESAEVRAVQTIARQHGVYIVISWPEAAEEQKIYNAAALIGPNGAVRLHYRKVHLWSDYEQQNFAPGGGVVSNPACDEANPDCVCIDGIHVCLMVCYDVEFPEWLRTLRLRNPALQLAIVPTACCGVNQADCAVPARALENGMFVLCVNWPGQVDSSWGDGVVACDPSHELLKEDSFAGRTSLGLPSGERWRLSDRATACGVLEVLVQPCAPRWQQARRFNPYLSDRRADLYCLR